MHFMTCKSLFKKKFPAFGGCKTTIYPPKNFSATRKKNFSLRVGVALKVGGVPSGTPPPLYFEEGSGGPPNFFRNFCCAFGACKKRFCVKEFFENLLLACFYGIITNMIFWKKNRHFKNFFPSKFDFLQDWCSACQSCSKCTLWHANHYSKKFSRLRRM